MKALSEAQETNWDGDWMNLASITSDQFSKSVTTRGFLQRGYNWCSAVFKASRSEAKTSLWPRKASGVVNCSSINVKTHPGQMKRPLLQWCTGLFSGSSNIRSHFLFFMVLFCGFLGQPSHFLLLSQLKRMPTGSSIWRPSEKALDWICETDDFGTIQLHCHVSEEMRKYKSSLSHTCSLTEPDEVT